MNTMEYEALLNGFFDEMDKVLTHEKKWLKIFGVTFAAVAAAAAGCILAAKALHAEEAEYAAVATGILGVIFFILTVKRCIRYFSAVSDNKKLFYRDVYSQVVAAELGLEVNCEIELGDYSAKSCGTVHEGRYVTYTGMMDGRPITLGAAAEYMVTKEKYEVETGKTVSSKSEWVYSPLEFECGYRGYVTPPVTVKEHELGEKFVNNHTGLFNKVKRFLGDEDSLEKKNFISLDDKSFRFAVICDDEVLAYKTLTPSLTEKIKALDSFASVNSLEFNGDTLTGKTQNTVLDLFYEPSLTGDMNKNRQNYTAERVLEEARGAIEKIKKFAAMLPMEIN